jgi:ankyrin repeat protein
MAMASKRALEPPGRGDGSEDGKRDASKDGRQDAAGADAADSARLLSFVRLVAAGERTHAERLLESSPEVARARASIGASARSAQQYFFPRIAHYMYAGDTALHLVAASFEPALTQRLLELGADVSASNRRGAQPLHYASDTNWDGPAAQAETIRCLCAAGADVAARDASGVAPLHRAVRTRGAAAVKALLDAGADPRCPNASGSTALHLAVQNTGRGGTGQAKVIERQRQIILLLLERGALASAVDGKGKRPGDVARADWIRELLATR